MRRSEPCRLVCGGMHPFSVGFGLRPQRYGYQEIVLRTTFASWQIYYPFFALNATAIKNLSYGQALANGFIFNTRPLISIYIFIFTNEKKQALQARVGGDETFFRRFRASPSTLRLSRNCPTDNLCLMRISFSPTPSTLRLLKICPTDRFWLMAILFSILRPQRYGYQKFVLRTGFG